MIHENTTRDENWTLTVTVDSDAGSIKIVSDYGPDSGSCITLAASGLSRCGMREVIACAIGLTGRAEEIQQATDIAFTAVGPF